MSLFTSNDILVGGYTNDNQFDSGVASIVPYIAYFSSSSFSWSWDRKYSTSYASSLQISNLYIAPSQSYFYSTYQVNPASTTVFILQDFINTATSAKNWYFTSSSGVSVLNQQSMAELSSRYLYVSSTQQTSTTVCYFIIDNTLNAQTAKQYCSSSCGWSNQLTLFDTNNAVIVTGAKLTTASCAGTQYSSLSVATVGTPSTFKSYLFGAALQMIVINFVPSATTEFWSCEQQAVSYSSVTSALYQYTTVTYVITQLTNYKLSTASSQFKCQDVYAISTTQSQVLVWDAGTYKYTIFWVGNAQYYQDTQAINYISAATHSSAGVFYYAGSILQIGTWSWLYSTHQAFVSSTDSTKNRYTFTLTFSAAGTNIASQSVIAAQTTNDLVSNSPSLNWDTTFARTIMTTNMATYTLMVAYTAVASAQTAISYTNSATQTFSRNAFTFTSNCNPVAYVYSITLSGSSVGFSVNSATAAITITPSAAIGTQTVTLQGISGTQTVSTTFQVTVIDACASVTFISASPTKVFTIDLNAGVQVKSLAAISSSPTAGCTYTISLLNAASVSSYVTFTSPSTLTFSTQTDETLIGQKLSLNFKVVSTDKPTITYSFTNTLTYDLNCALDVITVASTDPNKYYYSLNNPALVIVPYISHVLSYCSYTYAVQGCYINAINCDTSVFQVDDVAYQNLQIQTSDKNKIGFYSVQISVLLNGHIYYQTINVEISKNFGVSPYPAPYFTPSLTNVVVDVDSYTNKFLTQLVDYGGYSAYISKVDMGPAALFVNYQNKTKRFVISPTSMNQGTSYPIKIQVNDNNPLGKPVTYTFVIIVNTLPPSNAVAVRVANQLGIDEETASVALTFGAILQEKMNSSFPLPQIQYCTSNGVIEVAFDSSIDVLPLLLSSYSTNFVNVKLQTNQDEIQNIDWSLISMGSASFSIQLQPSILLRQSVSHVSLRDVAKPKDLGAIRDERFVQDSQC